MQELPVIKLPFYIWKVPDNILDICDTILKECLWEKNVSNMVSSSDIENQDLTSWINSSLLELKNRLYPDGSKFVLEATQIWANMSSNGEKHHRHFHPNSIYSGIIYLSEHESSGATRFYFRDPYYYFETQVFSPVNYSNEVKNRFYDLKAERGQLVIFPSNTWHETTANFDSTTRYTISFNTFFKGLLGSGVGKGKLVL